MKVNVQGVLDLINERFGVELKVGKSFDIYFGDNIMTVNSDETGIYYDDYNIAEILYELLLGKHAHFVEPKYIPVTADTPMYTEIEVRDYAHQPWHKAILCFVNEMGYHCFFKGCDSDEFIGTCYYLQARQEVIEDEE